MPEAARASQLMEFIHSFAPEIAASDVRALRFDRQAGCDVMLTVYRRDAAGRKYEVDDEPATEDLVFPYVVDLPPVT